MWWCSVRYDLNGLHREVAIPSFGTWDRDCHLTYVAALHLSCTSCDRGVEENSHFGFQVVLFCAMVAVKSQQPDKGWVVCVRRDSDGIPRRTALPPRESVQQNVTIAQLTSSSGRYRASISNNKPSSTAEMGYQQWKVVCRFRCDKLSVDGEISAYVDRRPPSCPGVSRDLVFTCLL